MIKLTKKIGIISRCIMQYRNKAQKDLGINGCQNVYFYTLNRKAGITQEELSKDLHLNKSNVTRNIQALSECGYINVISDDMDKRVNRVYLSEKGKEVFPLIKESTRVLKEKLLEGFTEKEIEVLDELLNRLAGNAERMCDNENI